MIDGVSGTAIPSSGVTGVTPVERLLSVITHLAIFLLKVDFWASSLGVSMKSLIKKSSRPSEVLSANVLIETVFSVWPSWKPTTPSDSS